MSRTAQYLRYLVAQMEQLRMIKIYRCARVRGARSFSVCCVRTPVPLRHT